jgi:hypothetical protein
MNMSDTNSAVSIIESVIKVTYQLPVQSQPPVPKSIITCPNCGTEQEKTSTCVKCWVIFEKIALHSRIQPPDNLFPLHVRIRFAHELVMGVRDMIRRALPGLILVSIALLPLIACFMVERWSGREFAGLKLSESKAVVPGSSGTESWNWNNQSDSAGTVSLSPEMNPIRVELRFSHLQLPPRMTERKFTYRLRLMDENGVAAFEKRDAQFLTAGSSAFISMLTGGDTSTVLLGTLNIGRGGNYKISFDRNGFNDTDISGFMTTAALVMHRNTVVVPIHMYIVCAALGVFIMLMFPVAKRRWLYTLQAAYKVSPILEKSFRDGKGIQRLSV